MGEMVIGVFHLTPKISVDVSGGELHPGGVAGRPRLASVDASVILKRND